MKRLAHAQEAPCLLEEGLEGGLLQGLHAATNVPVMRMSLDFRVVRRVIVAQHRASLHEDLVSVTHQSTASKELPETKLPARSTGDGYAEVLCILQQPVLLDPYTAAREQLGNEA